MQDGRGTFDSHQTEYRPDIDGLRAVAVLSVITYHLKSQLLPGGYLGVDIFFVLSGYLITNVIYREALNRKFSIARFYERRVRRIMPALLSLLIVVSVLAITLLLPIDLNGYAKSVFATLAFVANMYFWGDTGYFMQIAAEKPLLHVWSLGVEEQFYIIFPLLVVLCIRWRRSALLPIISTLVMLSLLANILADRVGMGGGAFYFLPTRAWELGAGALLALAPSAKIASSWARHALALLAAVFIVASLFYTGVTQANFVPAALWVVLGTTLAIFLGSAGGSWLTLALSKSVLVWIGLISYSLYLWHWPILVFTRYYLVQNSLSSAQAALAVLLMFALATLSWRYIERPFRNRSMKIGTVLIWVACGCAIPAIASVAILALHGIPSRFNEDSARIASAVRAEYHCSLNNRISFGALGACSLSLPSHNLADATVALFGNSHAQMYAPLVADILRVNNEKGILVPMPVCRPMPDLNDSLKCMAIAAKNLSAIDALPSIHVVVLSMTWDPPRYTPNGEVPKGKEQLLFLESLDRLIEDLKQHGKTVALIGPLASPETEFPSIVARQLVFRHKIDEPLFTPESTFMAQKGYIIDHYASRGDIVFIRPDRMQCIQNKCDFIRDGASFFADDHHVVETALPFFRPAFEAGLKQVFLLSSNSQMKIISQPAR